MFSITYARDANPLKLFEASLIKSTHPEKNSFALFFFTYALPSIHTETVEMPGVADHTIGSSDSHARRMSVSFWGSQLNEAGSV